MNKTEKMNTTVKTNKTKGVFIPMEIIVNKELTMNEKAVYAVVAYHTENGNGCFLSADRMAEMLGCSRRTVEYARKKLNGLGLMEPHMEGRYTVYRTKNDVCNTDRNEACNTDRNDVCNEVCNTTIDDTDEEIEIEYSCKDVEVCNDVCNTERNDVCKTNENCTPEPTNTDDVCNNFTGDVQNMHGEVCKTCTPLNKEKLNKEVVLESASSKALQSPAPLQLHSLSWTGLREGWDRFLSSVKEGKAVNADATCSAYLQELGNRGYDGTASKWQDAFRQATVTKKQWSVKKDDTPQEVTDYVLQCMRQGMSVGECEKQLKSNVTEGYRYTPRVHSIYTEHAEGLTSEQRCKLDILPF